MKGIKKNIDELAALLKLPEFNSVMEMNHDYTGEAGAAAYDEAIRGGDSEKKAEKARETAEQAAGDEIYGKWDRAVMAAVDTLFSHHKLMVVPLNSKEWTSYEYEILPTSRTSWGDAAHAIAMTIDGVGLAAVAPDDLKPSMEFVAKHLHWIKMYPEVYGSSSADRIYNSNWRD